MTLLTIHADTRFGKMNAYLDGREPTSTGNMSIDELEIIDDRTEEVLMHLLRYHCGDNDIRCLHCDLYEDEYTSLCDIVPCQFSVWKNIRKAMEEL